VAPASRSTDAPAATMNLLVQILGIAVVTFLTSQTRDAQR